MDNGRSITIKWTTPSAHGQLDKSDERANASMVMEFSNACPFKYYRNTFGCAYCPFKSADFGPIKTHTKDHKLKSMTLSKMKSNHSTYKADVSDLKCEICEERIPDISTLIDHLIEIHNKPLNIKCKSSIVSYLLSDGFKCADCGLIFDYFHNLNMHINDHSLNFICPECGKRCTSQERLNSHALIHKKGPKKFSCSKCSVTFLTQHKRQIHMMSEHNMYPYRCPYCVETFKTFNKRVAHLNDVHGKNINYPCKFCPRVFNTSANRSLHTRYVHIKDKPVRCEVCGQNFHSLSILKKHMLKHNGIKDYQCQVCNKAFGRKFTLTEHMRIHNDDRRFVCVHCGKAFVQKCSLKGHVETHHSKAELSGQASSYLASGFSHKKVDSKSNVPSDEH